MKIFLKRFNRISKTLQSVITTILDDPSNKNEIGFRIFVSVLWQCYKRIIPFPLVLPLDNGLSYIAEPSAGNSTGVIYTRIYESEYIIFLRRYLEKGGVIVDVGAHTGLYTLLLAPAFSRAVLFEPDPETFHLLRRNLSINALDCATAILAAASDKSGEGQLKVTGKYSGTTRLTTLNERSDNTNDHKIPVQLLKIDQVLAQLDIQRINFIKIDTEGHELYVLKGAAQILKQSRGALVLYENSSFESVCDFFEELGWKVFGIDRDSNPIFDKVRLRSAYNLFACGPENIFFSMIPESMPHIPTETVEML